MSSDSRWTGGIANREWQSGTRVQAPVDTDAITAQVRRYLADCRKFRQLIGPAHPTEDGVLKIVYHQGGAQKAAILAAFRHATSRAAA